MTRAQIGEIVELHADAVGLWLKLDNNNLKVRRGGRKVSELRRLSKEEEKAIRSKLIDKTPDQINMPYALWPRQAHETVFTAGADSWALFNRIAKTSEACP
jgi:hypothetical protein